MSKTNHIVRYASLFAKAITQGVTPEAEAMAVKFTKDPSKQIGEEGSFTTSDGKVWSYKIVEHDVQAKTGQHGKFKACEVKQLGKATYEEALKAKEIVSSFVQHPDWLRGIGIAQDEHGYYVRLNVGGSRENKPPFWTMPANNVRVLQTYVGDIVAQASEEQLGEAGVDSGTLILIDPAYLKFWDSGKHPDLSHEGLHRAIAEGRNQLNFDNGNKAAVIIHNFGGDGSYPVYSETNGKRGPDVTSFRVDFSHPISGCFGNDELTSQASAPTDPTEHYIENCKLCGGLISQCRCMGPRTQRWGICEDCDPSKRIEREKREREFFRNFK